MRDLYLLRALLVTRLWGRRGEARTAYAGWAFSRVLPAFFLIVSLVPATVQAATAGTAGNTILRNTVTVSYSDAYNVPQSTLSATVDLLVTTVSSAPAILPVVSGSTDGSGSTWSYTVRVRTTSNGPRLVSLAASDTASVNMSGYGAVPSGLPASVFLGSTIIDPSDTHGTMASWAAGASVTFSVPNDGGVPSDSAETGGSNVDGSVNGLKSGDLVYLYSGSSYYGPFSVGAVSETAAGSGSAVTPCAIELVNNLGAGALTNVPTAYAQIVEAKDLSLTVTQGSVTDATLYSDWTTTVTAAMAGATSSLGIVTVSHMGKIAVTKYVRNLTTPTTFGTGAYTFTLNGSSDVYYTGGVSGSPGEILEYLVAITDVGTGDAKSVSVSDAVPGYITLVSGAAYGVSGGGDVFARGWFNGQSTDITIAGSGRANVAYGEVTGTPQVIGFRLGAGCTPAAGGTLNTSLPSAQATSSAYLVYRVKIN